MLFETNGKGLRNLLGFAIVTTVLAACGGETKDASSTVTSDASSTASGSATQTVALSSSQYMVSAASAAIVTINRAGSSTGATTVTYTTINGSAVAGADYTTSSGTLTWEDGDTGAKTVLVPVTSNASGKSFAIALTSVAGDAHFGAPDAALIQVLANETVASNNGSSPVSTGGSGTSSSSSGGSGTSSSSSGGSGTSSSSSTSSTSGDNSVTVSWSAPTENTNGTALTNLAGFNIYYGTSSSAMTNKININTVGTMDYVVSNLASGNWYFAVTAVNASGVESVASGAIETNL